VFVVYRLFSRAEVKTTKNRANIVSLNILFCVAALALFLIARKAKSASDQNGQYLDKRFVNENLDNIQESSFNVASYNIQTGKSLDNKRNINASAVVLAQADLAGVQEVYATSWLNRLGFGQCQTHALAKRGSFGFLFCATRRRWFREHRGNALLSKMNVADWQIKMLPDQSGKSYRNMTIAKVTWQGESFHFINTHLHTRKGREEQLSVVLKEFAKYPRAILLGDFNSDAQTPLLKQALINPEISDAISIAGLDAANAQRIDWILTKGFNVNGGEMLEKGVSDHPYYQVNLSYK